MIELLVLPDWQAPPRTLDDWVAALSSRGDKVEIERESATVSWLELRALRARGYAVLDGRHVEAINFELTDLEPAAARGLVEEAAHALGWEVHPDEPGGDEDEDDPD